VVLGTVQAFGQTSNLRKKLIPSGSEVIQLDSLSIYPNSFKLFCNDVLLGTDSYELNHSKSSLRILKQCDGQLTTEYRVLPMNLAKVYGARDTSLIYNEQKGDREKFLISNSYEVNDIFGGTSLSKSGSISRGISFGNNQ
jgi:hypothetical protein